MNKVNKENTVIVTSAVFTVVTVLHLMRLITGSELFVGGYSVSLWLSVIALILSAMLAVFNLNLIQEKSQVFWLKFVLALVVFDAMFALYFWLNELSCLGISPTSFFFIFILDVVLILFLLYYVNKMKSLFKE